MSFGKEVAKLRKRKGISQKDFANRISISPQYLNDIEHDRRHPPHFEVLERMSDELECDLDVLTYLAGDWPADIRQKSNNPERIKRAIEAFRRSMENRD